MALSKKQSRGITVGGEAFRWAYSPDSGFSRVVVQSDAGFGAKLIVTLHWHRISYSFQDEKGALKITPQLVSSFIRQAQKAGWTPFEPGADFICDLNEAECLDVR